MSAANDVPLTPLSFLRRNADVFGAKTGVIAGDGAPVTWAELCGEADRLADAVRAHGVGAGERVAMLARNTVDLLAAHYGVPGAGAVLMALNTRLAPEEYAAILDDGDARVLLLDPFYADLIAPVVDRLDVDVVVALDGDVQGAMTDLTDVGYGEWVDAADAAEAVLGGTQEKSVRGTDFKQPA